MAKIHTLKINNYRCFKEFNQVFYKSDFICLIGRGDSGKSTLLRAISSVLSPRWNLTFLDTDFYNLDINNAIEIEVSLYDLPSELLTDSKYGLYKRIIDSHGDIKDDLVQSSEEFTESDDVLTIKLVVNKDLEPKWYVTNDRENQDDIEIRSNDRSKLNVFFVSDFIDRHFSWSKGNPLYSLLKKDRIEFETDNIITEAYRNAKDSINCDSFKSFDEVFQNIKDSSSDLGLSVDDVTTSIDFKNSVIKESNIALHENNIPFRLKGKGTKRLLSIAIQLELAKCNAIILIDELEQGLEPDRAKFLSKKLNENNNGQVFVTTHSNNILEELDYPKLFLVKSSNPSLITFDDDFQGCIRSNPEAFFSKKVIVCEGKTEIGICRSLNNKLIKDNKINFELLGISLVDGTGSNFIKYCEKFKEAGFSVCAFCDSDVESINTKKQELREKDVSIIDCEDYKSIEEQLFSDLSWEAVQSLIDYAVVIKTESSVLSVTKFSSLEELKAEDTTDKRSLLGLKAKDNSWFKSIAHGEYIGKIWLESLTDLEGKALKANYEELMKWINE